MKRIRHPGGLSLPLERLALYLFLGAFGAMFFAPIFLHARGGSHQSCQSMEKQIGLAIMMYAQDHDEGLPLCNWLTSDHTNEWQNVIYPYTKCPPLLRCPWDSTPDMDPANPTTTDRDRSAVSYLYNSYLGIDITRLRVALGRGSLGSRTLASVEEPKQTMAVADGHAGIHGTITPDEGRDYEGAVSLWCAQYVFPAPWRTDAGGLDGAPGWWRSNCGLPRHGSRMDGGNVLYVDGHVKFVEYHDAASVQAVLPFYPSVTGIDPQHAPTHPAQKWSAQETPPGE